MVVTSFGVSIVLHGVLIALYALLVGPGSVGPPGPSSREDPTRPQGTELVRIVELAGDELERPVEPETERQPVPEPPRPLACLHSFNMQA